MPTKTEIEIYMLADKANARLDRLESDLEQFRAESRLINMRLAESIDNVYSGDSSGRVRFEFVGEK